MRISIDGLLALMLAHLAFAYLVGPQTLSVSAWSVGPLTKNGRAFRPCPLSLATATENEDASALYTSVDITESIRYESEVEMKKVTDFFQSSETSPILIQTQDELASYMSSNQIQNYLFDCDGVLYRGTDPMPSASQTIQSLLDSGKKVFFVTNNAASSRMELKRKLEKVLQCQTDLLKEDMMIGSAYVAAQYLKSRLLKENKDARRVHVIGTEGLCGELQSAGFDTTGGPDSEDTPSGMSRDELAEYPFPEGNIDAMVIGLDNDFNYRKLCIATVLLQRNPEAILVSTNRDAFDLVGYDARHLPGNGALVSAVEAASGRTAINVGKPSPVLAEFMKDHYNLKGSETMMVGDRLDTDTKFGNDGGMKSGLVLTGCTTVNEIEKLILNSKHSEGEEYDGMMPTIIYPHVGYMSRDESN